MEVGDTAFDFADVVDEAVTRSGGETATAADVLSVRRSMVILSNRWTNQGYNTWRIQRTLVGISGASPVVPLQKCVDDVIQVNSIRANQMAETPMERMSASAYAQLTTKGTKGQPTQYWLQRTEPPQLHIYPIGSVTGPDSLAITYVERPESFERYSNESDVPGRWLEAFIVGIALDLARKRPPLDEAVIARLKGELAEAEDLAQRADRDRSRHSHRIRV